MSIRYFYLAVLKIIVSICGYNSLPSSSDVAAPYIVGGWNVLRTEFPWVVSISYFEAPFCGGTIVNKDYVVTAAHCLRYFSRGYKIVAGERHLYKNDGSEQVRTVKEVKIHPGFNSLNLQNDIGLVKVNESFVFNDFVRPATIANHSFLPESSDLVAVGWGLEDERNEHMSEKLLQVNILLLKDSKCKAKLDIMKGIDYNAGVFCAGGIRGKGTCFGDSGGPIHSGMTVIGLSTATAVCAREESPGVYTKLSHYYYWLETRIK